MASTISADVCFAEVQQVRLHIHGHEEARPTGSSGCFHRRALLSRLRVTQRMILEVTETRNAEHRMMLQHIGRGAGRDVWGDGAGSFKGAAGGVA